MTKGDILFFFVMGFLYAVRFHSEKLAKFFYFVAAFYFSKETIKRIKYEWKENSLLRGAWYLLKTITKYTVYFLVFQMLIIV